MSTLQNVKRPLDEGVFLGYSRAAPPPTREFFHGQCCSLKKPRRYSLLPAGGILPLPVEAHPGCVAFVVDAASLAPGVAVAEADGSGLLEETCCTVEAVTAGTALTGAFGFCCPVNATEIKMAIPANTARASHNSRKFIV